MTALANSNSPPALSTSESTATTEPTIPVTLIAGYLGAGKTTWLNQRLRDGVAPGTLVLVNDFGTINVDAELIDYAGERLLKLSSGCLCCSLSDELGTQLSRIGRWPESPAALIIETSGVARPRRIADMIHVARRFHLDRIVTLVDLASLTERLVDVRVAELVTGQIASADALSVNRGERLDPLTRDRLVTQLHAINPKATLEGLDAITDADNVTGIGAGRDSQAGSGTRSRATTDATTTLWPIITENRDPEWRRFAIDLPASISRQTLEALLAKHAEGLARAKGFLKIGERHYVFQWSGGRAEWTPTAPRPGSGTLVGIGFEGVTFEALTAALKALA